MSSYLAEATLGDVVSIAIGPQKTVFQVHKEILCSESEYFSAAYSGRWKETEERVTLDTVEVGVFKIFVHWLYTQQLPDFGEVSEDDADESLQGPSGMLLKACAFGHEFLVQDFERITHNRYVESSLHCPSYLHVIFAYEHLPAHSLLLDLMVEMQCLDWFSNYDVDSEKERRLSLPKEFLIQVMVRFAELRGLDKTFDDLTAKDFYMEEQAEEASK